MRFMFIAFCAIGIAWTPAPASAQSGADVVGGIIGGVVGEIIQQSINEAARGNANNGPPQQQQAPRRRAPEVSEKDREQQAQLEYLRKEYAAERRKCLDQGDIDACQLALNYPVATPKDRGLFTARIKIAETRQRLALEKEQKARALEEDKQREAAIAEERKVAEATAQAAAAAPPGTYVGADIRLTAGGLVPDTSGPLAAQVRNRMNKEADHLAAQDFHPTLAQTVGGSDSAKPTRLRVGLTAGTEYAFVAACVGCTKVDVVLRDASRAELARNSEQADAAIISGSPPTTADYEIDVEATGCAADRCHSGVLVLRKGPVVAMAAVQTAAVQTAAVPQPAAKIAPQNDQKPTIAIAVQEALRRFGCYQGEADGNWGAKSTAALGKFNRATKLSLKTDSPDAEVLAALSLFKGKVCTIECDGDEVEKDGACVPKARTPKAQAETQKARTASSARAPGVGGSCRPEMSVGKGCTDEAKRWCTMYAAGIRCGATP